MIEGFYSVRELTPTDDGFIATIILNKEHFIYKAHFPGNPITPGVCMLQIIQELISKYFEQSLKMKKAKNIKFLNILSPEVHATANFVVTCQQADQGIRVSTKICNEDTIFAKISTEYITE